MDENIGLEKIDKEFWKESIYEDMAQESDQA
jgi:hypothetical protein